MNSVRIHQCTTGGWGKQYWGTVKQDKVNLNTHTVARILLSHLTTNVLDANVPAQQCGSLTAHNTISMLFAARLIRKECHEHNQPLYAPFVYFIKERDPVNCEALGQFSVSLVVLASLSI